MKKPKHIKTEPIKSLITGKRVGTAYIYDEKEMKAYKDCKQSKRNLLTFKSE